MNRTDLFKSLVIQGVSREDALAYADWLKSQKKSELSIIAHPVQYAYLGESGSRLSALPELNMKRLGDIWGLQVDGVFWCRWHTDTLKIDDLKIWNDGQIYTMSELAEGHCSEYERIRWRYFYGCAGSEKITYWIPTVEDFYKLMPHIQEFSTKLKELEGKGHCVQDWFKNEGYWAYDTRQKTLTVFDVKKGRTKSYNPNEMYATRPIWLPRDKR